MKITLNSILFLVLFLLSSRAFAVTKTVDSSTACTSAGVCSANAGGAISGSNTLCDSNGQTTDTCGTMFRFIETYTCTNDATACQNMCISACNKIKGFIANPGIADVSSNVSSNSFTRSMCNAFRVVTGSAGKTFAAFAIIAVGIGFFSGKVSWGLMIGVAAGIAAMFGAPTIVAAISGQNTDMMCHIN